MPPSWWFKVTFLGWLSDPFKGLSEIQLGDQKVTFNHLAFLFFPWGVDTSRLMWQHCFCMVCGTLLEFFFFTQAFFGVSSSKVYRSFTCWLGKLLFVSHMNIFSKRGVFSELQHFNRFSLSFFFYHRKKTSQQKPHRQVSRTFRHRRALIELCVCGKLRVFPARRWRIKFLNKPTKSMWLGW